jgi:hypothetical protein
VTAVSTKQRRLLAGFVLGIGLIYYASNPLLLYNQFFVHGESLHARLNLKDWPYAWLTENNYTFRLADALLDGKLGLTEEAPAWLNEMIPLHGKYFAVFSLGSVLTMVPFAWLHRFVEFPAAGITIALIGSAAALFFLRLSLGYDQSVSRSVVLTLFAMLGTWLWTNIVMGGAWQFTLGFALIGELGTIYFTIVKRRPLIAGLFFAFAFGNRTEIILTAPVFIYLLLRDVKQAPPRDIIVMLAKFCAVPAVLGILTLFYNFLRFGSPFDFGLARIPGVLQEPWYSHGIFSLHAIPSNARHMLFEPWRRVDHRPYFLPNGFGGSIFLDAPLLVLIFGKGARHRDIKIAAWIAIVLLTLCFWCHGNVGGWQFSYRAAIVLLPWFFLLILETDRGTTPKWQIALLVISIAINAYATSLFLWTNLIQP